MNYRLLSILLAILLALILLGTRFSYRLSNEDNIHAVFLQERVVPPQSTSQWSFLAHRRGVIARYHYAFF